MSGKRKTKTAENLITIPFWVFSQDNGDGSSSPLFFSTEEKAEAYAETIDQRFCDDIFKDSITFNLDTGLIVDEEY